MLWLTNVLCLANSCFTLPVCAALKRRRASCCTTVQHSHRTLMRHGEASVEVFTNLARSPFSACLLQAKYDKISYLTALRGCSLFWLTPKHIQLSSCQEYLLPTVVLYIYLFIFLLFTSILYALQSRPLVFTCDIFFHYSADKMWNMCLGWILETCLPTLEVGTLKNRKHCRKCKRHLCSVCIFVIQ